MGKGPMAERTHPSAVHSLAFVSGLCSSSSAEMLVTGGADRRLRVLETRTAGLACEGSATVVSALLCMAPTMAVDEAGAPTLRLATGASGPRPVLPYEAAWEEVGLLDPDGQGIAWCEPRVDVPVRLSPTLCRVMATNGGNTYIVGMEECVVVAPASAAPAHLDAVIARQPPFEA